MAQLLEDSSFCEEFIQQCPAAVEVLNLVAQECSPGRYTAHHCSFVVVFSSEASEIISMFCPLAAWFMKATTVLYVLS